MPRAALPDGAAGGIQFQMPRGRVHYAVLALTDIAARPDADPVCLAEIAARHDLSLRYLEQVFNRLRRAGLVCGLRGPGGGYRLARPAAQITVAEIASAAESAAGRGGCGGEDAAGAGAMRSGDCPVQRLWDALQAHAQGYLAAVTLADIAAGRIPPAGSVAPAAGGTTGQAAPLPGSAAGTSPAA